MRVLFVTESYRGGAVMSMCSLLEAMPPSMTPYLAGPKDEKWPATSSVPHNRSWSGSLTSWRQFVPGFVGTLKSYRRMVSSTTAVSLARFIQANDIDLVYSNSLNILDGALAAKLSGRPHVWHARDLVGKNGRVLFPSGYRWFLESLARVVVANSHATAQSLQPLANLSVVPNGIRPRTIDPQHVQRFRAQHQIAPGQKLVLVLASLEAEWKNHLAAIDVMSMAQDRTDFVACFGGNVPPTPYAQAICAAAKTRLRHAVFVGQVDPWIALGAADVLLHPTPLESFGRVYLEAAYSRVPVVAADGPAAREVLGNDWPYLYAGRCPRAGAQFLGSVLSAERRLPDAVEIAHQRAQYFSLEAYVDAMAAVLDRAMTATGPRPVLARAL